MSWGKVCDTFHSHVKRSRAGLEATGLWAAALSWSRDKGTGGHIPPDRPELLCEDEDDPAETAKRCVARLVKARLWDVDPEGGWRFHDWADYQESEDEEAARLARISAARSAAGRRGAEVTNGKRSAKPATAASAETERQDPAKPAPNPNPLRTPTPSEPPPSPAQHAPAREGNAAPPVGSADPGPDLLTLAAELAAEEAARGARGIGTTVCEQQPRPPTPGQKAALRKIRDERAALALQPARAGPGAMGRSTLQQPAKPGEHDWSTGARAPSEF